MQITNIKNERKNIPTNPTHIKGIIGDILDNFMLKGCNANEMDKSLEKQNFSKMTPEEINDQSVY